MEKDHHQWATFTPQTDVSHVTCEILFHPCTETNHFFLVMTLHFHPSSRLARIELVPTA